MEHKKRAEMKIKTFLILNLSLFIILCNFVLAQQIIDIELVTHEDNSVDEKWIFLTEGKATTYHQESKNYSLKVLNNDQSVIWEQGLDIYFGYNGPMKRDEDYSHLNFTTDILSFKVPYKTLTHMKSDFTMMKILFFLKF